MANDTATQNLTIRMGGLLLAAALLIFSIFFLMPSADSYAASPEEVRNEIKRAGALIKKGEHQAGYEILSLYFANTDKNGRRAVKAAKRRKKFRADLERLISEDISTVDTLDRIHLIEKSIPRLVDEKKGLSKTVSTNLLTQVDMRVSQLWNSGLIQFTLLDDFAKYSAFGKREARDGVLRNSVKTLVRVSSVNKPSALLTSIFEYLSAAENGPALANEFREELTSIEYSRSSLEREVQHIYPDFARAKLVGLTIFVKLETNPRDPFFQEDFAKATNEIFQSFSSDRWLFGGKAKGGAKYPHFDRKQKRLRGTRDAGSNSGGPLR